MGGRNFPKIVVLIATGIVVAVIYYMTQRMGGGSEARSQQPGVVYVDPGIGAPGR